MSIQTVNEFYEDRFINFVESYKNDGYKILSTSCQPDADGETVWCAIMEKIDE